MEYMDQIFNALRKAAADNGSALEEVKSAIHDMSKDQRATMSAWLYDLSRIVTDIRLEKKEIRKVT